VLKTSADVWFSTNRSTEVTVEINKSFAGYFRRRPIFPTQIIIEEKPERSLMITFLVGRFDEIKTLSRCGCRT